MIFQTYYDSKHIQLEFKYYNNKSKIQIVICHPSILNYTLNFLSTILLFEFFLKYSYFKTNFKFQLWFFENCHSKRFKLNSILISLTFGILSIVQNMLIKFKKI